MDTNTDLPRFRRGTTARLWITARHEDGQFFTPFSLPLISVFDPFGVAVADRMACTPYLPPDDAVDMPANYFFDLTIAADGPTGEYACFVDLTDDLGNPVGSPRKPIIVAE
jgi:hypothetical protein